MKEYLSESAEVLSQQQTSAQGLSAQEAAARFGQSGSQQIGRG